VKNKESIEMAIYTSKKTGTCLLFLWR